MSDHITASFDSLLGQASDTAATYLRRAKREIDETFGEGYASKNPQLVAAFMQVAATDMSTATHAKVYGSVLRDVAEEISAVARAISDHGAA